MSRYDAQVCRRNADVEEAAAMRARDAGQYELAVDLQNRAQQNRELARSFERLANQEE